MGSTLIKSVLNIGIVALIALIILTLAYLWFKIRDILENNKDTCKEKIIKVVPILILFIIGAALLLKIALPNEIKPIWNTGIAALIMGSLLH